jgi:Flp pilus assembly protein TadG
MRRKYTSQRGASAVEFALILPILMLILWGIIEFSLLLYNQQVITNASREGARAGIVSQDPRVTDAEITNIVSGYCANHLISFGGTGLDIPPPGRPDGTSFGNRLIVTVNYQYQFLAFQGIANTFFGGSFGEIPLSAVTVMRYE